MFSLQNINISNNNKISQDKKILCDGNVFFAKIFCFFPCFKRTSLPFSNRQKRRNSGFTLLEILIATAILAVGLAVLSQLINMSNKNAVDSEEYTNVQLACQGLMNRIQSGDIWVVSGQNIPIDDQENWNATVYLEEGRLPSISSIRIVAQKYEYAPVFDSVNGETTSRLEWRPVVGEHIVLVQWVRTDSIVKKTITDETAESDGLDDVPEDPFANAGNSLFDSPSGTGGTVSDNLFNSDSQMNSGNSTPTGNQTSLSDGISTGFSAGTTTGFSASSSANSSGVSSTNSLLSGNNSAVNSTDNSTVSSAQNSSQAGRTASSRTAGTSSTTGTTALGTTTSSLNSDLSEQSFSAGTNGSASGTNSATRTNNTTQTSGTTSTENASGTRNSVRN